MKCIILGAGGHGRVMLAALLKSGGADVLGFADPDPNLWGRRVDGARVLGGEDILSRRRPGGVLLVNGLGLSTSAARRRRLYEKFTALGYKFATVAHPGAEVAPSAELGAGAQVITRAVIHPGARIGENAVVNTAAVVEHDAQVGAHSFIGPGAILCGGATVGAGAMIGAGAIILPFISVGAAAVVGAGAVVVKGVAARARAIGVPARSRPA